MPFFTTSQLGPRQSLTPEGFLVCHDVAIARTGSMLYAEGEVPVTAKSGIVTVDRDADTVFADATMRSFEGKAVTLDHPSEDVGPENWSQLSKGFATNVRRGTGLDNDLLIADLVIYDAKAIKEVRDGLREVSCGYDADYEEIEPGRGRQTSIVGNHVALVERGRCGTRCAIGDKAMKWIDRLRAAFKAQDEAAFESVVATRDGENPFAKKDDEDEDDEKKDKKDDEKKTADALTAIATTLSTIDNRLTALETRDAKAKDEDEEESDEKTKKDKDADGDTKDAESEEESEEEKEAKGKTGDSAGLKTEAADVRARAEILSPGLAMPTFDAAATPAKTKDALCNLKRAALAAAYLNPKTRDAVAPLVAGVDLAKLTCDSLHATFVGASEIVRRSNNAQTLSTTFDGAKDAAKVASSISTINARNAAFWARS